MDELILQLKVEAQGQQIQDIQDQLDKLKKSTKETSDGFSLADTKLGGMWKTLTEGVSKGVASLKTFAGALAATGIGLLLIAVAGLVNYFKNTQEGASKLAGVMDALGIAVREGPIVVFNALKVVFDAIKLGAEEIVLGWLELKSVFDKSPEMKAQVTAIKEEIDKTKEALKENAKATSDAFNKMGKDIKGAYDLGVQWTKLQQQIQKDSVIEAELQTKIDEIREKVQDVKNSDLTADQKALAQLKLLNEAKTLQHDKDTMALNDAQKALDIRKAQLAKEPDSLKAIENEQAAEREIQRIKQEGALADKAIERAKTQAVKEQENAAKAAAKELEKLNEEILEDSLKGQQKELAAEDFKYKELQDKYKDDAAMLEKITEQHNAKIAEINKTYADKEKERVIVLNDQLAALTTNKETDALAKAKENYDKQIKVDEDNKEALILDEKIYEAEIAKIKEEAKNKADKDHEAIQIELDKLNTKDQITTEKKLTVQYNQEREAFKKLCADKKVTAQELAKGLQAIDTAEDNAKKKLRQTQTQAVLGQASQELDALSSLAGKSTVLGKAAAIGGIIAKTAQGIVATWASSEELGPILGPILAAVQTGILVATGAKSIAQVTSVKEPAKQKLASGGWIGGNSPQGDYIPVQANSGEYIMNSHSMQNPQIASAVMNMNANPQGYQNAGQSISEARIAEIAANVVKAIPVVNSEHFFTLAQTNVKNREGIFTIP